MTEGKSDNAAIIEWNRKSFKIVLNIPDLYNNIILQIENIKHNLNTVYQSQHPKLLTNKEGCWEICFQNDLLYHNDIKEFLLEAMLV